MYKLVYNIQVRIS